MTNLTVKIRHLHKKNKYTPSDFIRVVCSSADFTLDRGTKRHMTHINSLLSDDIHQYNFFYIEDRRGDIIYFWKTEPDYDKFVFVANTLAI